MTNNIATRLLTPCIIALLLMLAACSHSSPWGRQGEIADSLIEQHPDSVLHLLQGIDYSTLDEEGQAHYGLLLTAARYKLYQPVDTTFINRSIAYYSTSHKGIQSSPFLGDKRGALGASLYYKAVVIYDLGKKQEATLLLKQAEQQAEHSDDELLRNKIYENLERVNDDAHNSFLALKYSKLFLRSSQILKDTSTIVRALDHLATSYAHMDLYDSVDYIHNCIHPLLATMADSSKAYTLGNLASRLFTIGKYERAETLLNEAIRLHPLPHHFFIKGKIAEKENNNSEAEKSYLRTLDFDVPSFNVKACRRLSKIYELRNNQQLHLKYLHLADSIQNALTRNAHLSELTVTQYEYEKVIDLRDRKRSIIIGVIVIFMLAAIIVGILVRWSAAKKRHRKMEQEHLAETLSMASLLSSYEKQIQNLIAKEEYYVSTRLNLKQQVEKQKQALYESRHESDILRKETVKLQEHLQGLQKAHSQLEKKTESQEWQMNVIRETMCGEIEHLTEQHHSEIKRLTDMIISSRQEQEKLRRIIDEQQKDRSKSLANGHAIYDKISNCQDVGYLTKEDIVDFTDYYIIAFYDEFAPILTGYQHLSRQELLYLILVRMKVDECMSAKIMGIQVPTLRTYRNRLKNEKISMNALSEVVFLLQMIR